jgi:phosphotransferase system enzyme I (PtsI)
MSGDDPRADSGWSRSKKRPRPVMRVMRGMAVSPGIAIGPVLVLDPRGHQFTSRTLSADEVGPELERLDRALTEAAAEVLAGEADARERIGPQYADILAAHARMVGDPSLRRDARQKIERDRTPAEQAIRDLLDARVAILDRLTDPHLAARAADVRDIQHRILDRLTGGRRPDPLASLQGPTILLAPDLSPSQTAGLDPARVLGFATETGGRTGHTAIVAAALEIPAMVGLGPFLSDARDARTAILDGDEGLLILDPDTSTRSRYRRTAATRAARFARLTHQAIDLPARARDGTTLELMGNIEFPAEAESCTKLGAAGIGLYRTEFLYLGQPRPPSEDEQVAAYASVVRSQKGRPVIIRTLDLGADKLPSYQVAAPVRNPFLGLRSIRLSLREPTLFRTQLRAILRVSTLGDVRVMFPLIATVDEVRRARALLQEVVSELIDQGVTVRGDLPIGAMIEVPAAAVMADQLAREVDFFSIGTNDLIQYTLAVDRSDETVADLYNGADPSVLRLISQVVAAADARGIEVSVCGSMGGDPLFTMLLVGLGLRRLSMPPHQIPEVKRVVRALELGSARELARKALAQDTAEAVMALLQAELLRVAPEAVGRSGS